MKARVLLFITISCAILFSALAFLVTTGLTRQFDQNALLWINQFASSGLDRFFTMITDLGGVIVVGLVTLLVVGGLLYRRSYVKALFVALSVGGVALVNLGLKAVFERPRPDVWEWLVTESNFSFPSGHATATAALVCCLIVLTWHTKWRAWAIVGAGLYLLGIGVSRLYLGVHYPTDILGGWLLGVGWVALVALSLVTYRRYRKTGVSS